MLEIVLLECVWWEGVGSESYVMGDMGAAAYWTFQVQAIR